MDSHLHILLSQSQLWLC